MGTTSGNGRRLVDAELFQLIANLAKADAQPFGGGGPIPARRHQCALQHRSLDIFQPRIQTTDAVTSAASAVPPAPVESIHSRDTGPTLPTDADIIAAGSLDAWLENIERTVLERTLM